MEQFCLQNAAKFAAPKKFIGCRRVSSVIFSPIFVHFNYGCVHPCLRRLNIVFLLHAYNHSNSEVKSSKVAQKANRNTK